MRTGRKCVEALDRHQGREIAGEPDSTVVDSAAAEASVVVPPEPPAVGKFQQPPHLQREGQLADPQRSSSGAGLDRGQARHEGTGRRSRRPKPGDLLAGGGRLHPGRCHPARSLGTQAEPPVVAGPLRRWPTRHRPPAVADRGVDGRDPVQGARRMGLLPGPSAPPGGGAIRPGGHRSTTSSSS